jgi:hypothetical protein
MSLKARLATLVASLAIGAATFAAAVPVGATSEWGPAQQLTVGNDNCNAAPITDYAFIQGNNQYRALGGGWDFVQQWKTVAQPYCGWDGYPSWTDDTGWWWQGTVLLTGYDGYHGQQSSPRVTCWVPPYVGFSNQYWYANCPLWQNNWEYCQGSGTNGGPPCKACYDCGGSAPAAPTSAATPVASRQLPISSKDQMRARQFAACLRQHGVAAPDPLFGAGTITMIYASGEPAGLSAATAACW